MKRVLLAAAIAVLMIPATATASFTQEPGSPFDVGLHPIGIYSADFNGDARPDLFTINEPNVSTLLRGAGGGYALEGPSITVGAGPSGAVITNVGGDARLDAVVANFAGQSLSVLIRGNGGFGAPTTISLGFQPGAIAAGNFVGDAATDLAITDWNSGNVRILAGAGNGTFGAPGAAIATGVNPPPDRRGRFQRRWGGRLAITNAGGSSVTVLLRNGAGFVPEGRRDRRRRATAEHHRAGLQRRRTAGPRAGRIRHRLVPVALRQPGGGFVNAPGSPVKVGDGPVAIESGDFNGDGLPDVVTANQAASTASVRLRTATGFVGDSTPEVATDLGASAVTSSMRTPTADPISRSRTTRTTACRCC